MRSARFQLQIIADEGSALELDAIAFAVADTAEILQADRAEEGLFVFGENPIAGDARFDRAARQDAAPTDLETR